MSMSIRTMRTLAYPRYRPQHVPPPTSKKDHASYFNRAIKGFLGPKNMRGEYFRNIYYYPNQEHKPSYIIPNGQTVLDEKYKDVPAPRQLQDPQRNPHLHPFPQNTACQTGYVVSDELKAQIVAEYNEGMKPEQLAQKYGMKMARVQAIVRLASIEDDWKRNNKISPDLQKYASAMYKLFPLFEPKATRDNLTEIPTPHKTLQQRFLTMAESEPFGPVDASRILDLPVAQDTLNSLTDAKGDVEKKVRKNTVVVAAQKQGDRFQFKFTERRAGEVGWRYGASRRDRKKDRGVGFDAEGRMVFV